MSDLLRRRQRSSRLLGKSCNFGIPAMIGDLVGAQAVWMLCYLLHESFYRQQYLSEREHHEWIDLGGES